MNKAFIFGATTYGENFTDREKETERLLKNFENNVNTIIISPRRWGKTSLVRKVSEIINRRKNKLIIIQIDAFMCRSENDFYKLFSTEVIKQTSTKWDEWVENTKRFLSRLSPKINMGIDPLNDFSLEFEMLTELQSEKDILNLPQRISEEKDINLVICIDEFQQIAEFINSKEIQKKMRSVWQLQDRVSYCLYGSKMHFLSNIFINQKMPFYKFGDIIYLQKISTSDWVSYICSRFEQSGKSISVNFAEKICQIVDNHSSYVQQLSWLIWTKVEYQTGENEIEEAINDLLDQNSILFYRYTESLTGFQINFLRALVEGVENEFTTTKILKKYMLGSSANVTRLKKSLEQKEIIDITGKKVTLSDPVFRLWLKKEMKM